MKSNTSPICSCVGSLAYQLGIRPGTAESGMLKGCGPIWPAESPGRPFVVRGSRAWWPGLMGWIGCCFVNEAPLKRDWCPLSLEHPRHRADVELFSHP